MVSMEVSKTSDESSTLSGPVSGKLRIKVTRLAILYCECIKMEPIFYWRKDWLPFYGNTMYLKFRDGFPGVQVILEYNDRSK